jgi:hypothetical protein
VLVVKREIKKTTPEELYTACSFESCSEIQKPL